jgi:hypothetical protein
MNEKTIISLLDVFGSTLVDITYNHMFDRAIHMKDKTGNSLTECYKISIVNYLKESVTPQGYKMLLNTLHHYTRITTIHKNISLADCLNLYVRCFVPQMYVQSLNEQQKHDVLSLVFRTTIDEFCKEIFTEHLHMIIDEHLDPSNAAILQDTVLKILWTQRELSHQKFIDSQKKSQVKKESDSSNKHMAVVKLTQSYKKSVDECVSLKRKNNKLQKKIKELQEMFLNHLSLFKVMQKELTDLKNNYNNNNTDHINTDNTTASIAELKTETIFNFDEETKESKSDNEYDMFDVQYN